MLELIFGILFAAGATYYVLLPILRPVPKTAMTGDIGFGDGDDPDDDWSVQTVALRALKEIEFDRATGKLGDADYESLKAKYTQEALDAMREGTPAAKKLAKEPRAVPVCPKDGPRPETDAIFCSTCGRRLGGAAAYCARCGSTLGAESRYCERCGARVAA